MNTKTKVIILGSGTCVPSLQRSSCSLYIENGPVKLLADIGAGTIRRLLEAGIRINDVSHIFISHFHPDHTGELASFLFSSKYLQKRNKSNPLTILAGKGFIQFFGQLKALYGNWIELDSESLNIIELSTDSMDYVRLTEGVVVKSIPVNHNAESIALRLETSNNSIVYSGDTDFCNNLITIACDADLFVCEAALPDNLKVDNHLTPSTAGGIATQANVKKLVLTHFYPECDKTDIAKECRTAYDRDLILAKDLMVIYL